jgi:hypothetical protein
VLNIDSNSFDRVEDLKYLVTTVTDQNSIQEEIMSILKAGNAFYYSMLSRLCSSVLPIGINVIIYRFILVILPVVLYRCET